VAVIASRLTSVIAPVAVIASRLTAVIAPTATAVVAVDGVSDILVVIAHCQLSDCNSCSCEGETEISIFC
jgi:hypothetical protein